METIQDLLIRLKIVQKVSNEKRHMQGLKRLGKGYLQAYRLNPYNPFSYVVVVIAVPITILAFGFVGFFQKFENPFKWN